MTAPLRRNEIPPRPDRVRSGRHFLPVQHPTRRRTVNGACDRVVALPCEPRRLVDIRRGRRREQRPRPAGGDLTPGGSVGAGAPIASASLIQGRTVSSRHPVCSRVGSLTPRGPWSRPGRASFRGSDSTPEHRAGKSTRSGRRRSTSFLTPQGLVISPTPVPPGRTDAFNSACRIMARSPPARSAVFVSRSNSRAIMKAGTTEPESRGAMPDVPALTITVEFSQPPNKPQADRSSRGTTVRERPDHFVEVVAHQ
jgi:hypothetical protein